MGSRLSPELGLTPDSATTLDLGEPEAKSNRSSPELGLIDLERSKTIEAEPIVEIDEDDWSDLLRSDILHIREVNSTRSSPELGLVNSISHTSHQQSESSNASKGGLGKTAALSGLRRKSKVICSDGDLDFTVTTKTRRQFHTFVVDSACVRQASSLWAGLIDSAPDPGCNNISIYIVDDCVSMIEAALQVAHFTGSWRPDLHFDKLVQVAEVCMRYDLVELMQPCTRIWVYPWTSKLLNPVYEMLILVAYQFGYFHIFEFMSEHIAERMFLSKKGEVFYGHLNLSQSALAGPILDNLKRMRFEHLQHIFGACNHIIQRYSGDEALCTSDDGASTCTSLALSSLLRGLRQTGLWPHRPQTGDIHESVHSLRERLALIEVRGFHGESFDGCLPLHSKAEDEFLPSIFLSKNNIPTVIKDTECDRHFKDVCSRVYVVALPPWEYKAKKSLGFQECDFTFLSGTRESGNYGVSDMSSEISGAREETGANGLDGNPVCDMPGDCMVYELSSNSSRASSPSASSDGSYCGPCTSDDA